MEPERQVLDGPKPGHGSTGEGRVTGGHSAARFCPQPRRNQGHLTSVLGHSCRLPLGFPEDLSTGAEHPDGKHAPRPPGHTPALDDSAGQLRPSPKDPRTCRSANKSGVQLCWGDAHSSLPEMPSTQQQF